MKHHKPRKGSDEANKPASARQPQVPERERRPPPSPQDDDQSIAGEEDPGSAADALRRGIATSHR